MRRSEAGLALFQAKRAEYLVFTNGGREGYQGLAAAIDLGIPESRVFVVSRARDTADEARLIAETAKARGWHRIILVTSGYHMGRAKLLLEHAVADLTYSLTIVPFPADSRRFLLPLPGMKDYFPGIRGLEHSTRAIKEVLGQLACRIGFCQ